MIQNYCQYCSRHCSMGVHLWVSHLFQWRRSLWRRTLLTERFGVPHPTGPGHPSGGPRFWRRQNIALYAVQKRIPTLPHQPQRQQQQQQNPDGGLSLAQLPSRNAIEEGAGTETGWRSGPSNVILGQGGGSSSLSSNSNKGNNHESIIIVRQEIRKTLFGDPTRPSSYVFFSHHTYE